LSRRRHSKRWALNKKSPRRSGLDQRGLYVGCVESGSGRMLHTQSGSLLANTKRSALECLDHYPTRAEENFARIYGVNWFRFAPLGLTTKLICLRAGHAATRPISPPIACRCFDTRLDPTWIPQFCCVTRAVGRTATCCVRSVASSDQVRGRMIVANHGQQAGRPNCAMPRHKAAFRHCVTEHRGRFVRCHVVTAAVRPFGTPDTGEAVSPGIFLLATERTQTSLRGCRLAPLTGMQIHPMQACKSYGNEIWSYKIISPSALSWRCGALAGNRVSRGRHCQRDRAGRKAALTSVQRTINDLASWTGVRAVEREGGRP
jgi:hypothetical protein